MTRSRTLMLGLPVAVIAVACGSKSSESSSTGQTTTSASSTGSTATTTAGSSDAASGSSSSGALGGAGGGGGGGSSSSAASGGASSSGASSASSTVASSGATTGAAASSSSTSSSSSASGSSSSGGSTAAVWVMGYYTSYNEGTYPVSAIDWAGLTHVAAAFYIPDGQGGWTSESFDAATAKELIAAGHANGRKVLASVGGANSESGFEGSTSSTYLSTFMKSLDALIAMGFDGIDIDWEGPNQFSSNDEALQTTLIDTLRSDNPSALLTMTAPYENQNFPDDLSVYGTLSAKVDRIDVMTYGMAGTYSGWKSWHSSPLHWDNDSSTPVGIDATVSAYLAAGVPNAKLGVGTGFYGLCYTAPVTGPTQALGNSTIAADDNVMSYTNIMASYYAASAYTFDGAAEVPFLKLSGANAEKCTYVSYEDPTSIAAKCAWIKAQGLGGTILWQLSEGTVPGATLAAKNPLLEATRTSCLE